jgi:hypothetical protein
MENIIGGGIMSGGTLTIDVNKIRLEGNEVIVTDDKGEEKYLSEILREYKGHIKIVGMLE